jgi:uncharacterized protein YndB with AHSA1/START domain
MIAVTASTTVSAPPERVWEVLCDTDRYAEWVVGTDAVLRADGPAREGVTYEEANTILGPWKARTSWLVREFEPPRRQLHVSEDVPLCERFEVVMEVQPEADISLVTLTLRAEPGLGPLGSGFARLMRGQVARNNRTTAATLAELIHTERPASSPA